MADSFDRIKKEYDVNIDKMNDLQYKIHILKENTFNNKAINSFGLAVVTWVPCVLSTFALVRTNMPLELVCPLSLAIPITTGIVGETILNKVFKNKEHLKEFSNAKKDSEILKEKYEYEIELEKLNAQNTTKERVYKSLVNNKKIMQLFFLVLIKKMLKEKLKNLKLILKLVKIK